MNLDQKYQLRSAIMEHDHCNLVEASYKAADIDRRLNGPMKMAVGAAKDFARYMPEGWD